MNNVRVISDIPPDKLAQVVKDLEYEVGKENLWVSLQPNGQWQVEYVTKATQQYYSVSSHAGSYSRRHS